MFEQNQLFSSVKTTLTKLLTSIPTEVLFYACRSGNITLAKKALAKGADINATRKFTVHSKHGSASDLTINTLYETPLLCAARSAEYIDESASQSMVNFLMAQPTLDLHATAKIQATRYIQSTLYSKPFKYEPENISFVEMIDLHDDFQNYCLTNGMRDFLKSKMPGCHKLFRSNFLIDFLEKQRAARE